MSSNTTIDSTQLSSTSSICSISLNMTDRLRLITCPEALIPEIRRAIQSSWSSIQEEGDYHGSYEFKLFGNPWIGQGTEAVPARRLLTSILTTMAHHGWNLLQAAGITKKPNGKDTLFFEKGQPDPDANLFAMSFNMQDRIRVIDAPNVMPCVKNAVVAAWSAGVQEEREYCGCLELKLNGTPWNCDGSDTIEVRVLLGQIIANVRAAGYKLYACVNINHGPKPSDRFKFQGTMESWVFRRCNVYWQ